MPLLFRKTGSNRKWDSDSWTSDADPPADAVTDLKTTDNRLSVFVTDGSEASLRYIIAAMAANANHIDDVQYCLLDESCVREIGLEILENPGKTKCQSVDSLHRDLVNLRSSSLSKLTATMKNKARFEVCISKQVCTWLHLAIQEKQIDPSKLASDLKSDYEKKRAKWSI